MHVPLKSFNFTLLLGCLFASYSIAQDATPAASPVVQTETEGAASTVVKDSKKEAADPTALDYLFNKKPQEGTAGQTGSDLANRISDKLKAMDSLNNPGFENRAMRARFEKYLSSPEVSEDQIKNYFKNYDQISKLLRDKKLFEAWKQLFVLADNEDIDAGLSRELANRIESVWNADTTINRISNTNTKLKDDIDTANRSADMMAESHAEREANKAAQPKTVPPKGKGTGTIPSTGGGDGTQLTMPSGAEGKLRMAEEYLQSLEARAKIKLNEVKMDSIVSKSKADFADYISTLFAAKRHYQVILAADFYRRVFDEGEYPVTMANQVNASLEAIRDVKDGLKAFQFKLDQNEIAGAAERLQEAFIGGENHPSVRALTRANKQRVAQFASQLSQMQNLIEARDFGRLDDLLVQMKKTANDFDPAKPRALVDGVKLESKMRLGKAKLAAQQGNLAAAMEEFRAAAEAWPANPQLENAAGGFFDSQDFKNQSQGDFDRLVAEQNYRKIFDNQLPFLGAVKGDSKREKQLKEALEKVKNAEIATEKANLLVMNGDFQGAWETLQLAVKAWPEDNKLNRLLTGLTSKCPEFISALNKAQEAETRKEYGYSLNLYVNAQHYYPPSQLANEGIERLKEQIFKIDIDSASMN